MTTPIETSSNCSSMLDQALPNISLLYHLVTLKKTVLMFFGGSVFFGPALARHHCLSVSHLNREDSLTMWPWVIHSKVQAMMRYSINSILMSIRRIKKCSWCINDTPTCLIFRYCPYFDRMPRPPPTSHNPATQHRLHNSC